MNHQIAAQAIDTRRGAKIGDGPGQSLIKPHLSQRRGGLADTLGPRIRTREIVASII